MLYYMNGNGRIVQAVQDRVFQGGAGMCRVELISPYPDCDVITASFTLPDGNSCAPVFLTVDRQLAGAKDANGNALVVRSATLPADVLNEYGLVKMQFFVRFNGESGAEKFATQPVWFTVERGVREDLPANSSDRVFERVVSAIGALDAEVTNKLTVVDRLQDTVEGISENYYTKTQSDQKLETKLQAVKGELQGEFSTKIETENKVSAVSSRLDEVAAKANANEERLNDLGEGGGGGETVSGTVMIPISYWQNGVAELSAADGEVVGKVKANSTVFVSPADVDAATFLRLNLRLTAQGENSLTFAADAAPTGPIHVKIFVFTKNLSS